MDTLEPVRQPKRRKGRPSEVSDKEVRLDHVPWEGIGPGDSLGGEVPQERRHGRRYKGEPWANAGARREVGASWNGEEKTRTDTGQHRSEVEPR